MKAHRVDACQAGIVKGLRSKGIPVWILSGCGDGVPDLLALDTKNLEYVLLECKAEGEELTQAEEKFFSVMGSGRCVIVRDLAGALKAVMGE